MRHLFFFLLAGCASVSSAPGISNFHTVNETFYRGARPSEAGVVYLKSLGVKTAVSLEEEPPAELKALFQQEGIRYFSMPMSVLERPSDGFVLEFLQVVLTRANQPVFVFSKRGKDRAGTMVAMYRITAEGWMPGPAYHEAKKLGFWPYRGDAELKKFILQMKDKKIYYEKAQQILKSS